MAANHFVQLFPFPAIPVTKNLHLQLLQKFSNCCNFAVTLELVMGLIPTILNQFSSFLMQKTFRPKQRNLVASKQNKNVNKDLLGINNSFLHGSTPRRFTDVPKNWHETEPF